MDHEGWDAVGEALADHKVPAIGQHGLVHPGDVAQQIVKPAAGHAACSVHIDAVEPLHNIRVVGYLKAGGLCLAEALHLHIAAVVLADGHGGVNDLGDDQHDLVQCGLGMFFFCLQLGHALGAGLDGGVVGVDLRLQRGFLRLVSALF